MTPVRSQPRLAIESFSRALADELRALQKLARDRRAASLRQAIKRPAQYSDPRSGRGRISA